MKDHIFELPALIFHMLFAFFTLYGYISNSQCDQLSDDLIAHLVGHCTSIAEVIGLNPVQA